VVPVSTTIFARLEFAVFPTAASSTSRLGVLPDGALHLHFRINAAEKGQFERTLIIADKGSYCLCTWEGCTAPMRDENQLHAAVVERFAGRRRDCHSTVQNCTKGSETARGIYNFVTKAPTVAATAPRCPGLQVETGLGHHLEIPVPVPARRGFPPGVSPSSIVITNGHASRPTPHQDDPSANTRRGPGGHAGRSSNTLSRAWSRPTPAAKGARNSPSATAC